MWANASGAVDARSLASGTRLGKYEILDRIAVGGMAELYLAVARGIEGFRKLVVLKRVSPLLQHDEDLVRMFVNEARLAAALDHPNIAQVIDIGRNAGEYFFVMEYLHGRDFRQLMQLAKKRDGLPLACAIEVVLGVARGLHHAHERKNADGDPIGLVHRDVSPSNVVITYEGSVKLVDFGIAKAAAHTRKTQAGTVMGKVGYMSPEQCMGEAVDRRSDVFALGTLLYEATTGCRAFQADSQLATMNRIIYGRWARPHEVLPGFSEPLEAIIVRAMETDPGARYPTALALQLDLEAYAHAEHVMHSPAVLADYLAELYGAPPYPKASVTTPAALPTETALTIATPPPRRVGRLTLFLLAMGGLVAIAAASRVGGVATSEPEGPPGPSVPPRMPASIAAQPSSGEEPALAAPPPVALGESRTDAPPPPEGTTPQPQGPAATPSASKEPAARNEGARSTGRRREPAGGSAKASRRRAEPAPKRSPKAESPYPPSYDPK